LLRVVVREGVLIPDPSASLDGRGAWVHPTGECVEASIKRKAWGRAMRSRSALDTAVLTQHMNGTIHTVQAETSAS
jgi:predicted RNA-binding protein YlxR (DUF448 family)